MYFKNVIYLVIIFKVFTKKFLNTSLVIIQNKNKKYQRQYF